MQRSEPGQRQAVESVGEQAGPERAAYPAAAGQRLSAAHAWAPFGALSADAAWARSDFPGPSL